jgi:hypothetical protein
VEDNDDESQRRIREEIKKGLDTVHERHITIRIGIICSSGVLIALVVSWAYVKVNARHTWLEVISTLFAPSGVLCLVVSFGFWYLRRRIRSLENRQSEILGEKSDD